MLSAITRRKRYLACALPMGLLDSLVPFANYNLPVFEAVVFVLSLAFVALALVSFSAEKRNWAPRVASPPESELAAGSG